MGVEDARGPKARGSKRRGNGNGNGNGEKDKSLESWKRYDHHEGDQQQDQKIIRRTICQPNPSTTMRVDSHP